jgi:hypothetical protein
MKTQLIPFFRQGCANALPIEGNGWRADIARSRCDFYSWNSGGFSLTVIAGGYHLAAVPPVWILGVPGAPFHFFDFEKLMTGQG